jgi:hypothetical protein
MRHSKTQSSDLLMIGEWQPMTIVPSVQFLTLSRFGPEVLLWSHCSTTREFIRTGLMQSSGYHIVVGAVLVFWSLVGAESPVSFVSLSSIFSSSHSMYYH